MIRYPSRIYNLYTPLRVNRDLKWATSQRRKQFASKEIHRPFVSIGLWELEPAALILVDQFEDKVHRLCH